MDAGFLRRLMATPPDRAATAVGMRDHVLAAMLATAAASGGRLTQARVLSLRVDDVPRALAGLPFASRVCELVRQLARVAGLAGDDPVACSRKRGADGRRRPVSRVQAYRIVRGRTGSGWSGTVRRLVGSGAAPATGAVRSRPATAAPSVAPTRPAPLTRPIGVRVREALGLWSDLTPPNPHPRG